MQWIFADWATWFQANVDGSIILCLAVVSVPMLFGFLFGIAHSWFDLRKKEIEATLKQQMIASGMSADEIERVLAARIDPKPAKRSASERGTAAYSRGAEN